MGFTLNQLEQERQIRKLQKKEDKDTKDYEQLSNLPKINNVELKGNKTTSDLGINADNVMLSDGVTSVEDALDGLTDRVDASSFGTAVDISDYGSSNKYTCPSDGYIQYDTSGQSPRANIYVNGVILGYVASATSGSIPVRKGMQVHSTTVSGTTIKFYPLV